MTAAAKVADLIRQTRAKASTFAEAEEMLSEAVCEYLRAELGASTVEYFAIGPECLIVEARAREDAETVARAFAPATTRAYQDADCGWVVEVEI